MNRNGGAMRMMAHPRGMAIVDVLSTRRQNPYERRFFGLVANGTLGKEMKRAEMLMKGMVQQGIKIALGRYPNNNNLPRMWRRGRSGDFADYVSNVFRIGRQMPMGCNKFIMKLNMHSNGTWALVANVACGAVPSPLFILKSDGRVSWFGRAAEVLDPPARLGIHELMEAYRKGFESVLP
jgi:hypothetical protein